MADVHLPPSVQSIPDAIAWWAAKTPGAPAILPADSASALMSYGALHERATALAGCLQATGIDRGDIVALVADGSVASSVSLLAAMRAGAALPLPPAATEAELAAFLRILEPALVLGEPDSPLARVAHAANVPLLKPAALGEGANPGFSPACGSTAPAAEDLALILHSSGTTGEPRGIPRTHRNLLAAARAYHTWVGSVALARVLITTPLSFGMGSHTLMATWWAGGSVATIGADAGAVFVAIERWQPTWAYIVPALLEDILRESARSNRPLTSTWRTMAVAGMPGADSLRQRVSARCGASLVEGYGCGEVGLIAAQAAGEESDPGCFARLLATEIATVDANGEVTAPQVPGEVVVRGPEVSVGYLGDAEATTAAFFPGGWFRTGDLGVIGEDGSLRLTGRIKEIINRGGEKVPPAEVDAALLAHPAVADAAAFAVADGRLGEEIAAAVVLKPGTLAREREVRREVAQRLAPHKVPRRIWFVSEIPRTASGKVQRGILTERYRKTRDA